MVEQHSGRGLSHQIDVKLAEDGRAVKKECKILLLGSGESGKSTLVKQMKIIHQNGYTQKERALYRLHVRQDVMEAALLLVAAIERPGVQCSLTQSSKLHASRVRDCCDDPMQLATGYPRRSAPAQVRLSFSAATGLDGLDGLDGPGEPPKLDLFDSIDMLWHDPGLQSLLESSSEFDLMDSAQYFLGQAKRIGAPGYVPNEADVLHARVRTTGVNEIRFKTGHLSVNMIDVGGQRSERRKWIHCFDAVTSVIFCAALSEYDQVLVEDSSQNRMLESLALFGSIVNSKWFGRASVILFLNKVDVFKAKMSHSKVPLSRLFPDYVGGADVNKGCKYILWQFLQRNRAGLRIYPHLTQATDTSNVRAVFVAIEDTILHGNLDAAGIL